LATDLKNAILDDDEILFVLESPSMSHSSIESRDQTRSPRPAWYWERFLGSGAASSKF